jgi:MoaA/NifB/PqqE/SkfB family radical SAM enzyme
MTKEAEPAIDGHKLYLHPQRITQWMETGDCFPLHVEIGPVSACNHKCTFCALDFVSKGKSIDTEVMVHALKDMANHGVKSVMFCGTGEPTLHRDLGLFVQQAKEFGLDVSLTTNGVYLDRLKREQCLPYLSWIKFSIDAGSKEGHSLIHGTSPDDFERVLENIKESVRFKRENHLECTIGTQFVMIQQNSNELLRLIERLREIEPDYLSIKPYADHPKSSKRLALDVAGYDKIKKDLKGIKTPNFKILFREETIGRLMEEKTYPQCNGICFTTLLDSKGNLLPCNLFYEDPEFVYGNLYEHSFSDIWNGEKRKEVLKRIKERGISNCREACKCDAMNKYLNRLVSPLGHDNFP